MKFTLIAAFIALTTACADGQAVRTYCDNEMAYTIVKTQDIGYRLSLHIGPPNAGLKCSAKSERQANLRADVKSIEEALTLIEQHRARALASRQAVP